MTFLLVFKSFKLFIFSEILSIYGDWCGGSGICGGDLATRIMLNHESRSCPRQQTQLQLDNWQTEFTDSLAGIQFSVQLFFQMLINLSSLIKKDCVNIVVAFQGCPYLQCPESFLLLSSL